MRWSVGIEVPVFETILFRQALPDLSRVFGLSDVDSATGDENEKQKKRYSQNPHREAQRSLLKNHPSPVVSWFGCQTFRRPAIVSSSYPSVARSL